MGGHCTFPSYKYGLKSDYQQSMCDKTIPREKGMPPRDVTRADPARANPALTAAARKSLVEEVDRDMIRSLYGMTYGRAVPCPLNTKGVSDKHPCRNAFDGTYHNTFQLIKSLREHGGGGVSVYHVAPEVRDAERAWHVADQARTRVKNDSLGVTRSGRFPRSNVTGLADSLSNEPAFMTQHVKRKSNARPRSALLTAQRRQGTADKTLDTHSGKQRRPNTAGTKRVPDEKPHALSIGAVPRFAPRSLPGGKSPAGEDWVRTVRPSRPSSAVVRAT